MLAYFFAAVIHNLTLYPKTHPRFPIMASKGGVNFVKFFFYVGNTINTERKQKLVTLAYATARDQQVAPTAILIR